MSIITLRNTLKQFGLPVVWQYFVLIQLIFILFSAYASDPDFTHFFNIVIKVLTSVGVVAGFIYHKQKTYPWIFLVAAVLTLAVAFILDSLIYFGLNFDPTTAFWIEQVGILFIGVFGLNILLLFEKKSNLLGFSIDYSLLVVSGLILIFLMMPSLLDTFVNELTLQQQLALSHFIVAVWIFILVLLNFVFIPSVQFKDIILFLLVTAISVHFFFNPVLTFDYLGLAQYQQKISDTSYHLAGALAVITIFVEKLEFKFVEQYTNKTGSLFLWVASVAVLTVIPFGVLYRWKIGLDAIDPVLLAIVSLILMLVMIIRFTVLINNSNKNRLKLVNIAQTDELTGEYNFLGFHDRYSVLAKKDIMVIVINIEDFRSINESYGREFGDKVIKNIAKKLKKYTKIKLIAHTGSDQFIVLLKVPEKDVRKEYESLHRRLGTWATIGDVRLAVPLTFGVSYSPIKIDAEVLINQAELALRVARHKRVNCHLYSDGTNCGPLHRKVLRDLLLNAIDKNYLPVHFQPIYHIDDGSLKAIELLIRIQSDDHGLLLPGQFLQQAQSNGLLAPLTKVCLRMVAENLHKLPDVQININLSTAILNDSFVFEDFIKTFKEFELSPKCFCLEIMDDEEILPETLNNAVVRLKRLGFFVAMDDFGMAYSSLNRLSVLPFDTVKIDRSVLLAASTGTSNVLESTITLVKRLGIIAIVEGVETIEQLDLVRRLGADSVQGFLFSKPISLDKMPYLPLNAANIIEEF